jgi:hypothetical protein
MRTSQLVRARCLCYAHPRASMRTPDFTSARRNHNRTSNWYQYIVFLLDFVRAVHERSRQFCDESNRGDPSNPPVVAYSIVRVTWKGHAHLRKFRRRITLPSMLGGKRCRRMLSFPAHGCALMAGPAVGEISMAMAAVWPIGVAMSLPR